MRRYRFHSSMRHNDKFNPQTSSDNAGMVWHETSNDVYERGVSDGQKQARAEMRAAIGFSVVAQQSPIF